MMVRQFGWNEFDIYRFYNVHHPGYPHNLPPPPNPEGLQAFLMACLEVTVEQINKENDPKAAKQAEQRERIRGRANKDRGGYEIPE